MRDVQDLLPWLTLGRVPGVGRRRYATLLRRFGSPEAVLAAPVSVLAATPGVGAPAAAAIAAAGRRTEGASPRELAEADLQATLSLGLEILTGNSPAYPEALKHIYDPPPYLFVRGGLTEGDGVAVAIVGSRRASAYGRRVAEELAAGLAEAGVSVVSGMARGIDGSAHRGALGAGGRTIGVLGCGLDVVYPPEHRQLYARVAAGGALITEYPPGTPPERYHFPERNRVISGLCRGVVVVEAGEDSGALLTVDFALDQGREVFAVPGSVYSRDSRGPHRLLRQGARLCESAADILEELAIVPRRPAGGTWSAPPSPPGEGFSEEERKVLAVLQPRDALTVDDVAAQVGLDAGSVAAVLLLLEVKGVARLLQGQGYVRSPGPARVN